MLLTINPNDPRPIYLQIAAEIKALIHRGELTPGEELPSVRELADSLGINLHTVRHAYERLRDQGVIYLRLGQRARVAPPRERPSDRDAAETVLTARLSELITEAYHLGVSPAEFRALVEELLAAQAERRES